MRCMPRNKKKVKTLSFEAATRGFKLSHSCIGRPRCPVLKEDDGGYRIIIETYRTNRLKANSGEIVAYDFIFTDSNGFVVDAPVAHARDFGNTIITGLDDYIKKWRPNESCKN